MVFWLVVWNMAFIFHFIYGIILPNWLSYFSRWFKPPTSNYVTMILASSEWQKMLHDMIMIWNIMIWSIDGIRSDSNYMFQPVPLFSSCARGCCWWPMKKACRIPTEQVPWSTTFCLEQRPKHQLICNAWSRALDISMQLQVRQIHDMFIFLFNHPKLMLQGTAW